MSRVSHRRQNAEGGFTLVELLVAITILAMVLAAVTGSVSVSSRMAGNVTEKAHSVDRQIQVRSFLRRELEQASTTMVIESNGREHIVFSGTSRSVTFVAPLPESAAVGGLHQLTLQVEEEDGSENLVLLHGPFLPQLRPGDWTDDGGREVLLEGMEAIEFSYLGDGPAGNYWSGDWTDTVRMPALIQVRFRSRDRELWPNIVVAPRIDSQQPLFSMMSSR